MMDKVQSLNESTIAELSKQSHKLLSFKVYEGSRKVLNITDIILIEKISKFESLIISRKGEFVVRSTLKYLQSYLPEKVFFRSHRSFIINLRYLDKISKINNYYEMTFYNCRHKALISHRNRENLEKFMLIV